MPSRSLPVRPNLDQLKHQAKDLLKAYRAGTAEAAAAFAEFHPERIAAARARLADAQLVVARSYHASSWTRLVQGCQLINAIWDDDVDAVERLVNANPNLLTDTADVHGEYWGPPLRSAAYLERRRITRKLDELGAAGLAYAFDRAGLRGRLQEALGGAAYTLSVRDTEFLIRMGARAGQGGGTPVETVIGSDSRRPADKRRILAIYEEHGYVYPGTAGHGVSSRPVRFARTASRVRPGAAGAHVRDSGDLPAGGRVWAAALRSDGDSCRRRHASPSGGLLGRARHGDVAT